MPTIEKPKSRRKKLIKGQIYFFCSTEKNIFLVGIRTFIARVERSRRVGSLWITKLFQLKTDSNFSTQQAWTWWLATLTLKLKMSVFESVLAFFLFYNFIFKEEKETFFVKYFIDHQTHYTLHKDWYFNIHTKRYYILNCSEQNRIHKCYNNYLHEYTVFSVYSHISLVLMISFSNVTKSVS